jgi:ankyrin repeat protein
LNDILEKEHMRKVPPSFSIQLLLIPSIGKVRPKALIFALLSIPVAAHAQDSVCYIFNDLTAANGRQVTIRGELFLNDNLAALGATECENRYTGPPPEFPAPRILHIWPTAIELTPSPTLPRAQVLELNKRAAEIKRIEAQGKTIVAYGTFSGRLSLDTDGRMPAKLTIDDARDITVETLPPAGTLPVIPICDLFQDLTKWKGQRIAVRAEMVGTSEGVWLKGRCKSGFVTDGHRWPALLTYGAPDYFGADPPSLFRRNEASKRINPKVPTELRGHDNVATVATFVGRLRMRDKYIGRCRAGGDYIGNGFGHLNGAAAELIIESVRDAEVRPVQPPDDDDETEPPCIPPNHAELCATAANLEQAASRDCIDRVNELLATNGLDSQNDEPSPALNSAIKLGLEPIARLLLEKGAPVNPDTKDPWMKPVILAAHQRRIGILRALMKAGAEVNPKDNDGTPWLAGYGFFDVEVSEIFLAAGADPNARDDDGATALMHASHYGYENEIKLLLAYRAAVDLKDDHGRTALMYAAEGMYVDAIPLLLARGADPRWRDVDGQTALDLAKKSGNQVAVELLESALGPAR